MYVKKENAENRICIIGAGIAGLTAGAFLTKLGYKVKIFEKENILGGRALSLNGNTLTAENYKKILSRFHVHIPFSTPSLETIFEKKMLRGYIIDLGFHVIGGGSISNVREVLSKLNQSIDIMESKIGFIENNGYNFPFLSTMDKIRILPEILRLLTSRESTMKKLDLIPMTETIKKYGKGKMRLILEIFSRAITTVNNLNQISTGETLRAQKNLLKGSSPVGYPKNGLQNISQTLASYIRQNGGEIHPKKTVKNIIIEENEAIGIIVENEEHYFKSIISNILVQNLFDIADQKHFPTDYVKKLRSLKGTGSLCAYYSLKKIDPQLIGKSFLFIERNTGIDGDDAVGMIDFITSSPKTGTAPSNHYLVQAYIICTPDEAKNKKTLETLKQILDKKLQQLIPDLELQTRWALYPATWHLDGVAKTIDNIKPEIKTPVDNLYIIGDCVKSPGIGINCAINSAKILCNLLQKTMKKPYLI
ncbi:MAG: NAD(P)/FAD-dependent oxidoreductase [Thermoplasmata archaeon]|nr:MAG: NAD(P)/FAD-dependent oxidoreductase [Thermoplasmata archaeon]RLF35107.1 MAG: NAD(P)/FAD-dependent oxidoreductase [Thermoplasmata archaeon]